MCLLSWRYWLRVLVNVSKTSRLFVFSVKICLLAVRIWTSTNASRPLSWAAYFSPVACQGQHVWWRHFSIKALYCPSLMCQLRGVCGNVTNAILCNFHVASLMSPCFDLTHIRSRATMLMSWNTRSRPTYSCRVVLTRVTLLLKRTSSLSAPHMWETLFPTHVSTRMCNVI